MIPAFQCLHKTATMWSRSWKKHVKKSRYPKKGFQRKLEVDPPVWGDIMSKVYSLFANDLLLPVYDAARGTARFRFGHVLKKTQWLSRRQIENLQNKNLQVLLKHAYETVPYYHQSFKTKHLVPNDIKNVDGLAKLPVLTKEDIRRNLWNLVSGAFPRKELIPCQSGGTGDPIRFFITREGSSWEIAAEYRAYGWAGFSRGDRCFLFWASPLDMAKSGAIIKRFTNVLERITVADTYVITNEVLDRFIQLLRKSQPEIIRGYASSVFMIAKRMVEIGVADVAPRAVITAAETLFVPMRDTIEAAFGCPVYDYYGTREVGAIAAQCGEHSGYHISAENVVVEFADEEKNYEPVAAGERGVILVTSLRNFGMPLIRYNIGDIGKGSNELCGCGRGLPLMSSIEGRVSDFMAYYDETLGRIVPVGPMYPIIISAVMHMPVENCQVILESINRLAVRLVKGNGYESEHTDFMVKQLQKHLGDRVKIDVEFVDFIPPLKSGKRSVFLSKIDPFKPPPRAEKLKQHA
jgi:phenylacetate-CoA ligase